MIKAFIEKNLWQILVLAVSMIVAWTMLQADIKNLKVRAGALEERQILIEQKQDDILILLTEIKTNQVNQSALLNEVRQDVKEL